MFDSVNIDELDDESSFDRQSVAILPCRCTADTQSGNTWDHELSGLKSDFKSSHNWCMTCRPVPMFSLWPVPEYSFTETFSAFCLVPRQRTSAQVPIVNRLVELGVRRFCIAAYKARSGEHTCQCPSVTVCWWMWSMSNWIDLPFLNLIVFFHYRWLWQRSVCGSSRKASTASDTQRSSKILVNLIHVVHFGISGTMTYTYIIISYCYVWIIFIQGNHIVGALTLLSTDDGCFMALQATRLDYFMQLQKEVMTATSLAKFRTDWQMPSNALKISSFQIFQLHGHFRSQRVKEQWVLWPCWFHFWFSFDSQFTQFTIVYWYKFTVAAKAARWTSCRR